MGERKAAATMMTPDERAAAIWVCSQCGEETAQGIECECGLCGPVTHQPIPEDSAHCGCQQGYILKPPSQHRWILMVRCPCPCHQEEA